jgi:hypothetical protein
VTYNSADNIYYLTNAERLALNTGKFENTSKFYEVDTKNSYVLYNNTWYPF